MPARKPYMVGQQEFAALYRVAPQMVSQWMHRGALDPATAIVVSGVRYWPLGFAARFGATTTRPKAPDMRVKQRLIEEQAPGWEAATADELPPIVGQQEVVELFRLPAQGNLATTMATGRFPQEDWLLSGSPLWLLQTVLDAVPALAESARTLPWAVDREVAAALQAGRYSGPGSGVLSRGRWSRAATGR